MLTDVFTGAIDGEVLLELSTTSTVNSNLSILRARRGSRAAVSLLLGLGGLDSDSLSTLNDSSDVVHANENTVGTS